MKSILLAAVAVTVLTTGAFAADSVADAPIASTYDWTGAYIGAQAGYAAGGDVDHFWEGGDPIWDYRLSSRGGFGGIFAGYNHQLDGGVVVGLEGDIGWGDIKATGNAVGSAIYTSTTKLDWTGSGRVRVGYALDRFMPYVTGGFAVARMQFEEKSLGNFYSQASKNLTGWTLGAGVEYAATENWTVRGEYRYTHYGKKSFVARQVNENWEARIRTHDFRLGVAYKF